MKLRCWFGLHKIPPLPVGVIGFSYCMRGCRSRKLWSQGRASHFFGVRMGEWAIERLES
jgi:hypothetical protein